MMYVSMAATALSTVVSVAGAAQQSKAAQAQAKYQAAVQRNNAQIAEYQAQDAIERGTQAEQQKRREIQQVIGQQRAAMSVSGLSMDSASFVDTIGDTAAMGEMDALTIRSNAAKQAWAYRAQGAGMDAQAQLYDAQAAQAKAALPLQIGGSLLSGAGSVASKWYQFGGGTTNSNWGFTRNPGGIDNQ
jgi:hypothetical protein